MLGGRDDPSEQLFAKNKVPNPERETDYYASLVLFAEAAYSSNVALSQSIKDDERKATLQKKNNVHRQYIPKPTIAKKYKYNDLGQ